MSKLKIAHKMVWFVDICARRQYFLLSVMSTEGGKCHEGLDTLVNQMRETTVLSALNTLAVVMKLFTSKDWHRTF